MQTINLDLSVKGIIELLHVKQGDVGRKFKAVLTDNMVAYPVPEGAAVSVWFSGASGAGNYTEIGEESAVSVSGNVITVEMIAQILTNAGKGEICLVISTADGDQLGTWNIPYCCESVPGMGSEEAKSYFTAFSQAVENLSHPDTTLSVAGQAADAAATGTALAEKAPIGYGFGENLLNRSGELLAAWEDSYESYCVKVDTELAKMENYTAKLVLARGVVDYYGDMYRNAENSLAILYRGASANFAHLIPLSHGDVTPGALWRMQKANGVWQEPEWVNPPMIEGVEYRTTERYKGAAVYKKLDASGGVLWKAEGETSWRGTGGETAATYDGTVEVV